MSVSQIPGGISAEDFQVANSDYLKTERTEGKFNDPVSRELIAAGAEKGRKGEFLVKQQFEKMGYKVLMLNGKETCDLLVKIKNKWKKVEVKTAKQSGASDNFCFSKVKPPLYDLLCTVFVGYDYTSIQVSGEEGKRFIEVYGSDYCGTDKITQLGSKVICFNRYRMHKKTRGKEIFFDLTKKNIQRLV